MKNRVWIELELPSDDASGHHRAKLLNQVMRRLGADYDIVFWHPEKRRYCFVIDSGGSYVEAGDNGHWFGLDWLGREP